MKKILLGVFGAITVSVAATLTILALGLPSFAADEPHSEAIRFLIAFARERSIAGDAAEIRVPDDLDSLERIRRGSGNYDAMCASCHLAPGTVDTEIRKGLYPQPPDLSTKAPGQVVAGADARRFQIIKHGIKGSGMPAWSKGGMDDGAIWDLVALLRVLPATSATDYRALVTASAGHTHAGMEKPEPGYENKIGHEGKHDVHRHEHAGHDRHTHR